MPNVPVSGSGYTFTVSLFSQSTGEVLDSPTIESADFSVSTDGGAYSSLSSTPTVTPAASGIVEINLAASEVGNGHFTVKIKDDVGAEWKTMLYHESVGSEVVVDNAAIADAVWDEVLTDHLLAGSTGDALKEALDHSNTGSGSISHTITVCDNSGNPLDGVAVWITTDSAGTNIVAGTSYTDTFGNVVFMLDAGAYYGWQQLAGYNFTNPTSFTVS